MIVIELLMKLKMALSIFKISLENNIHTNSLKIPTSGNSIYASKLTGEQLMWQREGSMNLREKRDKCTLNVWNIKALI